MLHKKIAAKSKTPIFRIQLKREENNEKKKKGIVGAVGKADESNWRCHFVIERSLEGCG